MNLSQLKYIIEVYHNKNFARAAEHCFVTQPTLSMQISKLEEELGILIFDRSRQPVIPTVLGEKIIKQAYSILREVEKINEIIIEERGEVSGEFKLGIIPTIAPYLLPLFLERFIIRYPKINLVVDESQTNEIVEKLRRGDLDAGIVATPLKLDDIKESPLYYEPFTAYVSKQHPFYYYKKIKSSDLRLDDIWLLKDGHCFRDHVIKLCEAYGKKESIKSLPVYFEGGSLETLMKLVENNYGMTLLPYLASLQLDENKSKLNREFETPVPYREIGLVYHRSQLKKYIIDKLKKKVLQNLPEGVGLKKPETLIEWK